MFKYKLYSEVLKLILVFTMSYLLNKKNQSTMMMTVILMSLMVSTMIFYCSMNLWLSLLVVLIYVSGIMVVFMYVVSLTPNEKTSKKTNKIIIMMSLNFLLMNQAINSMTLNLMESSYKCNISVVTAMMIVIALSSYIPPKMVMNTYKGMKTCK